MENNPKESKQVPAKDLGLGEAMVCELVKDTEGQHLEDNLGLSWPITQGKGQIKSLTNETTSLSFIWQNFMYFKCC